LRATGPLSVRGLLRCAKDPGEGFGAGGGVGLGEDLFDVPFDRAFGHEQSFGDRCACVALGDESEDLELSWGDRRVEPVR
jgi:hypothetical protein